MNEGVVVEKSAAVSGTQQRPAPVGQISELFARFSVDHCPVRLHLPRQMSFTLELDTFLRPSIPEFKLFHSSTSSTRQVVAFVSLGAE
jgi:hypothetical protein